MKLASLSYRFVAVFLLLNCYACNRNGSGGNPAVQGGNGGSRDMSNVSADSLDGCPVGKADTSSDDPEHLLDPGTPYDPAGEYDMDCSAQIRTAGQVQCLKMTKGRSSYTEPGDTGQDHTDSVGAKLKAEDSEKYGIDVFAGLSEFLGEQLPENKHPAISVEVKDMGGRQSTSDMIYKTGSFTRSLEETVDGTKKVISITCNVIQQKK